MVGINLRLTTVFTALWGDFATCSVLGRLSASEEVERWVFPPISDPLSDRFVFQQTVAQIYYSRLIRYIMKPHLFLWVKNVWHILFTKLFLLSVLKKPKTFTIHINSFTRSMWKNLNFKCHFFIICTIIQFSYIAPILSFCHTIIQTFLSVKKFPIRWIPPD